MGFIRLLYGTSGAILLSALISCSSVSRTSRTNLAFLYNPEKQFAAIEHAVFHTTDTTSDLFVRVNYNDLIYLKNPFSGIYTCSYRLSCKMKSSYESAGVLAGSSIVSGDSINYGKSAWTIHTFELPARYPGNYTVELEVFDLNRQASSTQFVEVRKTSLNGRQNFLVFDQNEKLVSSNQVFPGDRFRVVSDDHTLNELTVSCYFRDFPEARPPFVSDREPVFDYKPDSVFEVELSSGQTGWLQLERKGFYHFRKDTSQREGLTLFVFDDGFPEIYTPEQLRAPLKYITTNKEFDLLMASGQPKAAVDNFWLSKAGNEERAKSLIQKYYRNVEESNAYFTSYLEGWKTDRGLIYTVLGKPNYVYRSENTEEWIYGEPEHRNSLWFTFVKVKNPFTDRDYMLLRSPTFKDPWNITVQSWRR
jgi:GWxTD domain-containing protein